MKVATFDCWWMDTVLVVSGMIGQGAVCRCCAAAGVLLLCTMVDHAAPENTWPTVTLNQPGSCKDSLMYPLPEGKLPSVWWAPVGFACAPRRHHPSVGSWT